MNKTRRRCNLDRNTSDVLHYINLACFIKQIKIINIIIIVIINTAEWPRLFSQEGRIEPDKSEMQRIRESAGAQSRDEGSARARVTAKDGKAERARVNCQCALRIPEMGCGGRFKWSPVEWIILFHGGANTSVTATRILSGLGIRIFAYPLERESAERSARSGR
jgi:hypothetical protein